MKRLLTFFMAIGISISIASGQMVPGPNLNEGFEDGVIPDNWTVLNLDGGLYEWEAQTANPRTGTYAARVRYESSTLDNDDWLITPPLYVTSSTTDEISFWIRTFSSTASDPWQVLVSTTDTNPASFTMIDSGPGMLADYVQKTYSLDSYGDAVVYVAIRYIGSYDWYLYVDDFVGPPVMVPTCPAPINLEATNLSMTTADLSWTAGGTETLWHLKYGAPGFDPATEGTLVSDLLTSSYELTGLTPITMYEFYVQADCGVGDQSVWAGPGSFQTTSAPLSGNYTINSSFPTDGTNFNNFTDLAAALNLGGFAGPVVVDVVAGTGPYNEQVILGELPNSSAVNTLTINGNGETLEYLSSNTNERATLKLDGTDYVTVNDLIIKSLGTTTTEYGFTVHLMNGADFNTFNNCQFITDLFSTSLNYAAFVTSNSNTSATLAGLAASNLTITNSVAIGGYYGMVINGPTTASGAPFSDNNVITNNEIKDFRLYGLYLRGQTNSLYSDNLIYRPDRDNVSTTYMLYITQTMSGTEIINNQIFDFAPNAANTLTGYGIYGTGVSANVGEELLIANNLIYGWDGMNGGQYGMYLLTTDNTRIYHNTIALDHVNHPGASIIRGIHHSGNLATIDFRNNIISITSNSTGVKYCYYFAQTAANLPNLTSNNNVLHMGATAGTNHIAYWSATNYTTLANWQTLYDQNSVGTDPDFVDLPNGDLMPQSPFADNIGADLTAYVPFDIYGEPRSTTPDPGAIEFEGPSEGIISGVVRDAVTDDPIIGAHVIAGDQEIVTVAGGEYEFILFGGDYIFEVHKAGYETLFEPVTIMSGQVHELDLLLYESANVPGPVLAELNTDETAVNLTWGLPSGQYEILYDDGIADNATAWGLGGNMNALRFTPAGYPAKVIAGSVNIYDGTYPVNGNALVPFQMAVYDDSGPLGYPGEELAVVNVTPSDFGWVHFDFSEFDIEIASGDFYLVMIQGGNYPNCAPIAIDQTNPVMRSYSRFVTGGAPWTPAGFNDFMMRAIVEGPGGPSVLAYGSGDLIESERISRGAMFLEAPQHVVAPVGAGIFKPIEGTGTPDRAAEGYRVYQLAEGDEGDESLWTIIGNPTGTSFVDNSWPDLDDGAYRWAVKAKYPNDIYSEPTFSNVLGKNWGSDVSIIVTLSDPNVSPAGIQVALQNTVFPQYNYNATTDADGEVHFTDVWKGNYDLTVFKFAYNPYMANVEIEDASHTFNVTLLETPIPPTGLYVNPVQIHATWEAPSISLDLLEENWSSGGFTANGWTIEPPATNWSVIATFGNPAPSARFYFSPSITNYTHSLVSKELNGVGLPNIMLKYDIYLSNFSSATLEQMAVDVWNGSTWVQVANYTNAGGSIPWTTYTHNITDHALGQMFKIRFRAHGADSWNINNWNIDNIMVYGEVADGGNRGVLGYFVYLDDIMAGFTEETHFQYQPEYVNYGQTYTAGVQAVYESGFSPMITYNFTSQFLYPPCDLEGTDIGHAVALTWNAPGTCDPFGGGGGGGGGTGDLYEIKYHNGIPLDGYYQQFNYGYGVVYNVAGYSNVTVEMADFRHSPWGVFGTWAYKLHVVDWNTHTLLYTTPVMQTTVNDGWELEIPLNSIEQSGLVGIFMEPMGNIASDAYPCIDGDQQPTTSSFFGALPNWSGMASAGVVGNFLMDLWIMADPMDGGERQLVKAPVLDAPAPLASYEVRSTGDTPRAVTVQNEFSEYSPLPANYDQNGERALFDLLASWPVGVGGGEYSVATDGQFMYTAAWNSANFYKYTLTGTYIESFTIAGAGSLRDLTYDGQYFYGAPNSTTIYQMDFTAQTVVGTITAPAAVRGIAYDADNDGFWVTNGWNPPIRLINRSGTTLQTVNSVASSLSGLGWEKVSDGTPYLWAYTQPASNNILVKIDIATGATLQTFDVASVVSFGPDAISGGMDITNLLIPGKWVFLGTGQNDVIWVLELADDTGGGPGAPVETAGFRLYRNGSMIAEVDGETFSFTDDNDGTFLPAGTYNYTVTAIYEYGEAIVESLHEGPASVTVEPGFGFVNGIVFDALTFQPIEGVEITAGEFSTTTQANGTYSLVAHEGVYDIHFDKIGYALHVEEDFEIVWQETKTLNVELMPQDPNFPFMEDWSSGSFNTQAWTFTPSQGNWRMSTTAGNPAPSAEFYWSPSVTNYSFALTSQMIDARAALQNVTLEFDIFLNNFSATAAEKITVEIWDGSEWVFVTEFKNDFDIPWTTHQYDVTEHAAGKMTQVRFRANGANSFNINWWYLDNIKLHTILPPEITVNPDFLIEGLFEGQTSTKDLTVCNIGDGTLNFTTQIEYLDKSNEFTIYPVPPGDKVVVSDMDVSTAPFQVPGGEPETPARNEVVLNFDGPNFDAIGLTAGGNFHLAARFPSSMVGQYAGYALTSVDVYINDVPSSANLKIWGAGTGTSPGAILHQQSFTSTPNSWITINLNNPVILDGTDIWVGYDVTHGAGQFPAGCDAGPANPNGDWISMDGVVWEHLAGFGLNYNWNIRAKLNPGEGLWLSVSPNSGTVAPGDCLDLIVGFDATGLIPGEEYHANLKINSNDPDNPTVIVPVTLDVLVGIDELDREAIMVYPVPASDMLSVVTTQGIRHVRMFSYTGQVVYETNTIGESTLNIDVKPFNSGAYILQFITEKGQTFNKRILISR